MREDAISHAALRQTGCFSEHHRRSNDGFTLLELMIVLFLIGLIAVVSMPFFAQSLSSGRFNETARQLSATIRHARALSQIKNETQVFYIDLDSGNYGIEGHGSSEIPKDINIKVIDPAAGEIYKGRHDITFSAFGGSWAGTIVLWNNKKKISIETDPVVGAVAIK